jgi:hypothetical protein
MRKNKKKRSQGSRLIAHPIVIVTSRSMSPTCNSKQVPTVQTSAERKSKRRKLRTKCTKMSGGADGQSASPERGSVVPQRFATGERATGARECREQWLGQIPKRPGKHPTAPATAGRHQWGKKTTQPSVHSSFGERKILINTRITAEAPETPWSPTKIWPAD